MSDNSFILGVACGAIIVLLFPTYLQLLQNQQKLKDKAKKLGKRGKGDKKYEGEPEQNTRPIIIKQKFSNSKNCHVLFWGDDVEKKGEISIADKVHAQDSQESPRLHHVDVDDAFPESELPSARYHESQFQYQNLQYRNPQFLAHQYPSIVFPISPGVNDNRIQTAEEEAHIWHLIQRLQEIIDNGYRRAAYRRLLASVSTSYNEYSSPSTRTDTRYIDSNVPNSLTDNSTTPSIQQASSQVVNIDGTPASEAQSRPTYVQPGNSLRERSRRSAQSLSKAKSKCQLLDTRVSQPKVSETLSGSPVERSGSESSWSSVQSDHNTRAAESDAQAQEKMLDEERPAALQFGDMPPVEW